MHKYTHSGKIDPMAPALLILAGIPLLALLSAAYAYLSIYIPLAGIVTVLLLFGYVMGTSFVISILGKKGKCRSLNALLAFGFVGGLLCLYFSWIFFLHALVHKDGEAELKLLDLVRYPQLMWAMMCSLNETGWFTIKGATPSGIFLWICWAIEAAVIVLVPTFMSGMMIDDELFCEKCGVWCETSGNRHLQITEEAAEASLGTLDPLNLMNFEPTEDEAARPCIKMEILQCKTCTTLVGMRFRRLSTKVDDKGNLVQNSEKIPGVVLTSQ